LAPGGRNHALGQDKVLLKGWLAGTADASLAPLDGSTDPPASAIDFARRHHEAVREISRAMIFEPKTGGGD
jgi:hypothetical protein